MCPIASAKGINNVSNLFMALLLLSFISLIVGLVRPSVFNKVFKGSATRGKTSGTFAAATIVFFILFGVTSPKTPNSNPAPAATDAANQTAASQPTAQPTTNPVPLASTSPTIIPQQIKTPPASNTKNTAVKTNQPTPTLPANSAPAAAQPSQPAPTPTPAAPKSPATNFGDGNYVVGTDIQAGTYRTRVGSPGCYYARLSGFSGSMGEILANNNTDAPAIITISASDKGFNTSNCGTWTQDLSEITSSQTSFGDGIFIVGTDMQPGTYRSTGSTGCYYARVSGFSGTNGQILANDNTDTSAVVTILASDKGFVSSNCGTWTKIN